MNYQPIIQLSPEWWALKVGKISGTRYGQVISGRENNLIFELINENLSGYIEQDDFTTDDMTFGRENESKALDLYEEKSGIKFERGGVIMSDFSDIHMASPDGINIKLGIVAEVKCTQHGAKQIKRFFKGPEPEYPPQIKNYFAVSDEVKEVHWISYCPYRPERPLVVHIYKRNDISGYEKIETETTDEKGKVKKTKIEVPYTIHEESIQGRNLIVQVNAEIVRMTNEFTF
jgi:hypothetical protein